MRALMSSVCWLRSETENVATSGMMCYYVVWGGGGFGWSHLKIGRAVSLSARCSIPQGQGTYKNTIKLWVY